MSAFIEDCEARGLSDDILHVCCGEMGRTPKINKKLLSYGFESIDSAQSTTDIEKAFNKLIQKSPVRKENWGKIKASRSKANMLGLALSIIIAFGIGYNFKDDIRSVLVNRMGKIVPIALAYSEPTNITYDGKNLWICDWYTQSIYKHKNNETTDGCC